MPKRSSQRIERREGSRGHSYFIDGAKADGVTTLLGQGIPKPALPRWASKSVAQFVAQNPTRVWGWFDEVGTEEAARRLAQVPWSERDAAAVKGTEVHRLADELMHDREVDVPAELVGYVEACERFLYEWQIEPIVSEVVVANRAYNYCGTLDFVGRLPDGNVVIGDYKTGKSGLYAETALQLAAYANAEVYIDADGEEQSMSELGIGGGLGVWLRPDGYSVYRLDISENAFQGFLASRRVAHLVRDHLAYPRPKAEPFKSDELPIPCWENA